MISLYFYFTVSLVHVAYFVLDHFIATDIFLYDTDSDRFYFPNKPTLFMVIRMNTELFWNMHSNICTCFLKFCDGRSITPYYARDCSKRSGKFLVMLTFSRNFLSHSESTWFFKFYIYFIGWFRKWGMSSIISLCSKKFLRIKIYYLHFLYGKHKSGQDLLHEYSLRMIEDNENILYNKYNWYCSTSINRF